MGLRAMNKKLDEQRESDWRDNMAFDVMRELIRREAEMQVRRQARTALLRRQVALAIIIHRLVSKRRDPPAPARLARLPFGGKAGRPIRLGR